MMRMGAHLYVRPGNLYKEFSVEESITTISEAGRPLISYDTSRNIVIKGALANASPEEQTRFKQEGHPITHTIVEQAVKKAKPDDRLHLGNRTFIIKYIDEAGGIGYCTIYYVQERMDVI